MLSMGSRLRENDRSHLVVQCCACRHAPLIRRLTDGAMNKKLSDFAVGCIALAVLALACLVLFSAQTLLLLALFGCASMLTLFLWSRKSRLAKAAAIAVMAVLMLGYVVPKAVEAVRISMAKDLKQPPLRSR